MKQLHELIGQLSQMVDQQEKVQIREFEKLIKDYRTNDWYDHMNFENYRPKNTTLFRNEDLKIKLLFWDSYQQSTIHGHPKVGGFVKVLAGTLIENRFDPNNIDLEIGRNFYMKGDQTFIHDEIAFHQIKNPSVIPAISLHIYCTKIILQNQGVERMHLEFRKAA